MIDYIEDISVAGLADSVWVKDPADPEACLRLKQKTIARICVGRAGPRYTTQTLLRLRADHAVAMDAVWSEVDESQIDALGFFRVQSLVRDKDEYLTRPDLGRRFSVETLAKIRSGCLHHPDIQIIVADGLSSTAINQNIGDIYPMLIDGFQAEGYTVGTTIFVKYGRVAAMDVISETLGAKVTILLVGERPGLAVGDSMGCYMAYESSTAKPESQRNVVSNIHKNGLPPVEAGAHLVSIAKIMMEKKISGVDLKL